ncbi:hypothetical protein [Hyalangium rubrum]|uniref:Delta-60 repeat domain-containing protein n=1 Tax=Hyalangium rubrum TaxID=3103134 RepID=A0ABU5H1J1_9BACT|nr:hypothetical protein [Hyalangium sp. s54d21]MDY7226618.1 hypothetical protein [Hyalangium sp. s54d21]
MKNEAEYRGLRTTLVGATVLALSLALMGGCGDDTIVDPPEKPTENDAGTQVPDAGTGGNDGGTTPDAGTAPLDSEFAVARLNSDGTSDTTFGSNGVARLDLGPSTTGVREVLWSMARDSSDRLVLFGSRKGTGERVDADRVTVRLSKDGALDTAFATDGVFTLNIANLADNPRHGIVQPDGKIVSSGYTAQPTGVGSQTANRIVLARLGDDGKLDNSFGSKGLVNSNPLQPADPVNTEWGFAEAYSVGLQDDKYVTAGYCRITATSTGVDLCSFRYTSTGQFDTTWGTNGFVTLDLISDNDRARNMAVLPDGRVFIAGSGTPASQNIDALAMLLQRDGARDTTFAPEGYKLYSFGRPDDAFFGAAASADGNWVAAAGHRAGGTEDEDSTLLLIPTGGSGAEFAQPMPSSETANDRFLAVTFDGNGKVVASGYVTENGDNRMVVARFNTDGTRDTTFGTGGIVTLNLVPGGTEESARAVVVQSDGKIVVAGTVEKK